MGVVFGWGGGGLKKILTTGEKHRGVQGGWGLGGGGVGGGFWVPKGREGRRKKESCQEAVDIGIDWPHRPALE